MLLMSRTSYIFVSFSLISAFGTLALPGCSTSMTCRQNIGLYHQVSTLMERLSDTMMSQCSKVARLNHQNLIGYALITNFKASTWLHEATLFSWGGLVQQPLTRETLPYSADHLLSPEMPLHKAEIDAAVDSHAYQMAVGRLTNCLLCKSLLVKNLRVRMVHGLESAMLDILFELSL